MARRRRVSIDEDAFSSPPPRRRSRRRIVRRLLVVGLLAACVAVAAGPQLLGSKALRPLVLTRIVPASSGRLECAEVSLSWTGVQRLGGVQLVDAQGATLLTANSVTIQRSLFSLFSDARDLGRIVVDHPVAAVTTHSGGSNWESFFSSWSSAQGFDASSANSPTKISSPGGTFFELSLVDGDVDVRDLATGQQWRFGEIALTAVQRRDASTVHPGTWQTHGQASVVTPDAQGGWTIRSGTLRWNVEPSDGDASRIELICDRLPLAPFASLLARLQSGVQLAGTLSADLLLSAKAVAQDQVDWTIVGRSQLVDVRGTAPILHNEIVGFDRGDCEIDGHYANGTWQAKKFHFDSEWMEARWKGKIRPALLSAGGWSSLADETELLSGRVDLASLTRMLPQTLQLRSGIAIDGGSAKISLERGSGDRSRPWRMTGSVQNLRGSDGQREIHWKEEVEIAAEMAPTPDGLAIQRAVARSPFINASIETASSGYAGDLEFDLDRLQNQLGQLIDFSRWRFEGKGTGTFRAAPATENQFAITARLDSQTLKIVRDEQVVWDDPSLLCELNVECEWRDWRPVYLSRGDVAFSSPQQSLRVELLAPFDLRSDPISRAAIHAKVEGSGPLEAWRQRLALWDIALPDDLAGQAQFKGQLHHTSQSLEIRSLEAAAANLRMTLDDVPLDEPQIELRGDFHYDWINKQAISPGFTLQGSTLALQTRNVSWRPAGQGPPTLSGEAAFRADLERLSGWLGLQRPATAGWARGKAVGQVQLTSDATGVRGNVSATCEPCAWVAFPKPSPSTAAASANQRSSTQPDVLWSEPRLEMRASVDYASAADRLSLHGLRIKGQTIEADGETEIDEMTTARMIRGQLNLRASDEAIAAWTLHYLGPGITLQGVTSARVQAAGQLGSASRTTLASAATLPSPSSIAHWSQTWRLQTETNLQGASLYGLPIGPTRLAASLVEGQVPFEPIETSAGSGKIKLQPRIVLAPGPLRLEHGAGEIASRVEISPAVSESMLKYAAPVLAGATRAEGTFSAEIDGLTIPLDDRRRTKTAGRLVIHRLNVAPGPLLADLTTLVQQIDALTRGPGAAPGGASRAMMGLTATDKTVEFQVVDGRVYHRGLEFLVDDVPVRSYGSVGFDDTLALVIEVPVQEKWVRRQRALQPLVGKMLEIPIGGTFDKPQIERRALADLSRQVLQGAAEKYIGDEINNALDRLLRPK